MKKRKPQRNLNKLVTKNLEDLGFTVAKVECWQGPIKRDLFGVADLVAFDGDDVILVQVTSREHKASRKAKVQKWVSSSGWVRTGRRFWLALVDQEDSMFLEGIKPSGRSFTEDALEVGLGVRRG